MQLMATRVSSSSTGCRSLYRRIASPPNANLDLLYAMRLFLGPRGASASASASAAAAAFTKGATLTTWACAAAASAAAATTPHTTAFAFRSASAGYRCCDGGCDGMRRRCRLHPATQRSQFAAPGGGSSGTFSSYHTVPPLRSAPNYAADADAVASAPASSAPVPPSAAGASNFATSYHAPVMATECIDAMLGIGLDDRRKGKKRRQRRGKKGRDDDDDDLPKRDGCDVAGAVVAAAADDNVDRPPALFVDGTLGGGGHTAGLLERLRPGDVVLGCDVDPSALSAASERLGRYTATPTARTGDGGDASRQLQQQLPLFVPVQSNFRDLTSALPQVRHPVTGRRILQLPSSESEGAVNDDDDDDDAMFVGVDGLLLDLGVSSHQIDTPDRGFAFMKDGPLDMRLWNGEWSSLGVAAVTGGDVDDENAPTPTVGGGLTAADICNEFDATELIRIFRTYGDEPRAKKIASAIVTARPLRSTTDLVNAVSEVTPEFARKGRRMGRTATLARIFQSLRIVVNEEDAALVDVFEKAAPALVRKGGRLVVLSYHSMEDRAAKRIIRDGVVNAPRGGAGRVERDVYGNVVGRPKPWRPMGKKRKAMEEEVEINPRARSATLRIGERQEDRGDEASEN